MAQGLLLWSPCHLRFFLPFTPRHRTKLTTPLSISATLESQNDTTQELTARERRRLRNERRETKMGTNWREEVEERLLKKPKKRYASWTEELNLDTLANLGPQWWIVRVSRVRGQETAELIARLLARNFPHVPFEVYAPAVKVKRKLKNGSISVKPKPLFPGCVFLRCIMNKEIHDFIRDCDGVGGFVGSKVGNTKRQINKPRPVSEVDMEEIFKKAKEEQENYEREFEEEQQQGTLDSAIPNVEPQSDSKPKRQSKKSTDPLKLLTPGSTVRVVSGNFAEFEGSLKKVNRKTRKVTVGFTLFGKESLVDLDVNEIVAEKT
ncbi:Transcription elongation factor [Trema orientale]|uniref:Transcription elongation factor n=1 Tax=Trema orientale TaxID=63057 RepID=A0A2P5EXA3_TREOI|nr:Transcription elongation factor [Trema orientale]